MNYYRTKMKTIDSSKTVVDPVIAELRRHKSEIAEAFGCDVMALGRSLQRREIGDSRFKTPGGEQDGGGRPATLPESKRPS
ncbi:MAG: hypothetical protein DVB22_001872 [Verrucomicrobia bacterium]|nr:MAG: hypothetical protein DVB22_001872 [Verrucomicrobiota bacterium]